jgi:hypothetical protein
MLSLELTRESKHVGIGLKDVWGELRGDEGFVERAFIS